MVAECKTCKQQQNIMKRCVRCKSIYYCSRACQAEDWPAHKLQCNGDQANSTVKSAVCVKATEEREKENRDKLPQKSTVVTVKCNRKKYKISVTDCAKDAMKVVSETVKIPLDKLKLICKGKVVTEDNFSTFVFSEGSKIFMALGEESEDESGLHSGDIETIMEQLHVDRNRAVRGLKECKGDLIDAILFVGDKL
ncbi:unnamed protein product [Clavelina lepadiformis]|uniref:MYND-type domain-containing protein n=1 Tax=Clavelina lepadiformis TaxID=159417 RepID=A0ABP0FHK3_CLALP